jgi:hypothetical protein
MFDHLIEFEPDVFYNTPEQVLDTDEVAPAAALDAKIKTKDWLAALGAVDSDAIATELDTQAARDAFANLVTSSPTPHPTRQ